MGWVQGSGAVWVVEWAEESGTMLAQELGSVWAAVWASALAVGSVQGSVSGSVAQKERR